MNDNTIKVLCQQTFNIVLLMIFCYNIKMRCLKLGGIVMRYNFDEYINRKNTDSVKYDFAQEHGKPQDATPLWIADMDFKAPNCITNALIKRAEHGIFGYTQPKQDYFQALENWFKTYHNWHVKEDWLVKTPGVVFAFSAAIRSLTKKDDAIIIQQPVYPPFAQAVNINQRKLVVNQLLYDNGKYTIDFADFEDKIIKNNVKMFIACNPHNPVGRVWTKEELEKLGDICLKHKVIVVCDELHQDFIYNGYNHTVFAGIKKEFLQNTITCTAPSKTFNLAGVQISNIFIANPDIKELFELEIAKTGYKEPNIFGPIACKAAYQDGRQWLDEVKMYLQGNLDLIRSFLKDNMPEVQLIEPEGTYVAWLDFNSLGLSPEKLDELLLNKAKLWLDAGVRFGKGGEGFARLNMACSRPILDQAMHNLLKIKQ